MPADEVLSRGETAGRLLCLPRGGGVTFVARLLWPSRARARPRAPPRAQRCGARRTGRATHGRFASMLRSSCDGPSVHGAFLALPRSVLQRWCCLEDRCALAACSTGADGAAVQAYMSPCRPSAPARRALIARALCPSSLLLQTLAPLARERLGTSEPSRFTALGASSSRLRIVGCSSASV